MRDSRVKFYRTALDGIVESLEAVVTIARWEDPDGCAYECGSVFATIADPLQISGAGGARITTAVPEPESYALMLAGLLMVGRFARRKTATA